MPPGALDAIVIGSGPNGLAAAIALARAGRSVRVYEAQPTPGGGTRSAQLTKPGFVHDICSTVHALVVASPFLSSLPLAGHGLEFVHPDIPFAHPFDDGTAAAVYRSVDETADALGADCRAYRSLMSPLVARSATLMEALLGPLRPRDPLLMARFGLSAIRSASGFAKSRFSDERTRALFAGAAAHSIIPLEYASSAGFGLVLMIAAHAAGWPFARGGSQTVANAMTAYLQSLGGEVETGTPVESLAQLPRARAVLCDVTPRQFLRIAGDALPASRWKRRMAAYRYGPGVFKLDWALSEPVPWRAAECRRAGTIHLGGTLAEIADSERAAWEGRVHQQPYVLLTQPSIVDGTRAPMGRHTLWAYCHVPNGCTADMTGAIESQIERFAPGFRDTIVARHAFTPAAMEQHNANLVGGDISGGAADLGQLFTRPVSLISPYRTPIDGVYLCSSSTPPGGGVHGMCGYHAARAALRGPLA
ncbi:MAG TPA: NAD(P)/FAD-dependent oxidoreductase [Vicinamibacterales bacterium]